MAYPDVAFWKKTYRLCRTVAVLARRRMKNGNPLWRTLHNAASDVPVILIVAWLSEDREEIRATLLHALAGLQSIVRALFVLTMHGEIGHAEGCAYLHRCADVQCCLLAFYRGQI